MLNRVLKQDEVGAGDIYNSDASMNDTDPTVMGNFFMWEAKNRQQFDYGKLRRDDKIERIFIIFELLIDLMESDLAMWCICYP